MDCNSSFYIAYKPNGNVGYKGSEVSFIGAVEHALNNKNGDYLGTIIVNKKELDNFFNQFILTETLNDYLKKYEYQERKYLSCINALDDGYHLFIREVDGNDTDFCNCIEEIQPFNSMKILFRDI